MMTIMTGCFYPKDELKQNQTNPEEFITVVQGAIDKYREMKGGHILPIKNSTMDTPLYEKYKVDFGLIQQYRLLTTLPANAFESGGGYIYVIVDADENPKVKLLDVASYQAVNQIQDKVNTYRNENNGKLPLGKQISANFYSLDLEQLKQEKIKVNSVYNRNNELNFLIEESGVVSIEYAFDLMKLIDSKGLQSQLTSKEDLRDLLVHNTPFVPIQSVPYYWDEGHPIPRNE